METGCGTAKSYLYVVLQQQLESLELLSSGIIDIVQLRMYGML